VSAACCAWGLGKHHERVRRRLNGVHSREENGFTNYVLTEDEEFAVVAWLNFQISIGMLSAQVGYYLLAEAYTDCGLGANPNSHEIAQAANNIVKPSGYCGWNINSKWAQRFSNRYGDSLKRFKVYSMSILRRGAEDRKIISEWFNYFKETLIQYRMRT
jgi:hypothetical protein